MNIKEKIFSALILSGINIEHTSDIDILVSERDALWLQSEWKNKLINFTSADSVLFRSNLSRYKFSEMDIEILGSLEVNKEDIWTPVEIKDFIIFETDDFQVKTPTLEEQERILVFFGRKKDLDRLDLIRINKKNI
jgi:hypothetical protein